MGIKEFTKVFEHSGEFKYKDFKDKNVVIDASVEIYRASLGMKIGEQLTNSFGVPTSHINVILLNILKLRANVANQYWVFDYNQKIDDGEIFHNPLKQLELKKRKERRKAAEIKLTDLKKNMEEMNIKKNEKYKDDDLFSDESDDEEFKKCKEDIQKQEKVAFKMEQFYIEDIIFLLNALDVPWMECPAGYESEQICAMSTLNKDIFGVKMDYVFTPDSDALVFGAAKTIKREKKQKLFKYELNTILKDNKLKQDDLIKIAIILGSDFAEKTPRIGPKTVLKKYKDVVLTDEQEEAFKLFKKKLSADDIAKITIKNIDTKPFTDAKKYKQLLDWLELVKDFNRGRIKKQFHKQKLFEDVE